MNRLTVFARHTVRATSTRFQPTVWRTSLAAVALSALLTACGGGGADEATNTAPVARAGADRSVALGATVTLDGSASSDADGDSISYQWTMLSRPAGSAAALSRPTDAAPTFVPDRAGTYRLRLVVSDGQVDSARDEVVIEVAAANAAPQASAGATRSAVTGTRVTLDGSGSTDPNGDSLTYAWSLTERPPGSNATLSSATSVAPSFTPELNGDYVATLIVSDGKLQSSPATVLIKAGPANVAPMADAGANQNVLVNSLVLLDGSRSSDANGDALTWRWYLTTRPTGSQATLNAETNPKPNFVADVAGDYVITLIVHDGLLTSEPDTLIVNAGTGNVRPVAVPGPSQSVTLGTMVTLDGSGSTDANGDALAYAWTLTARPAGSNATLADGQTAQPSFTTDAAGDYVVTLVVNDGTQASEPQGVLVRASAANAAPVADAGPAQTVGQGATVTLDGSRSSDADGSLAGYAWTLTGKPTGSAAALSSATAQKPTFVADKAGTYVATLIVSDGLADSAASTVTVTVAPANAPQIALGAAEPLSGTVTISLTSTPSGTSAVTWYLDLKQLGTGSTSPGNALSWNTAAASNGSHQLLARIQASDGSVQDVRRTVEVANSTVNLSASAQGTTGEIGIVANASSTFGITSVTARLGQTMLGTLTQPNACSGRFCDGTFNAWRFTLDGVALGSGSYTVVVSATDGAGSTREVSVPVSVSNPPNLTLDAPANGAIVFAQLRVNGSTGTDKAGAVTVSVRFGDVEILNTTQSNFATSYDITGLTPGSYTLTVRATDNTNTTTQIQRSVVVASQAGLTLEPAMTLSTGMQWLAVEGTRLLVRYADQSLAVHDLSANTITPLQSAATIQYATDWQISQGRVYAQAKDTDCTPTFNCIYAWDTSGKRSNLSTSSPFTSGSSYQENPVAKDGYVIWTNWNGPNTGSYTVYQVSTGTFTKINQPSGINYVGNTDYDFAVVDGVIHFYFWGQTGGSGTSSTFDVFKWLSSTQTSSRLTQVSGRAIYTHVDGERAAWQQTPIGGSTDGTFSLMAVNLTDSVATQLSAAATQMWLDDGVLAWVETTPSSKALKASAAGSTYTLSAMSTTTLHAVGGGAVVYSQQGKLYLWKASAPSSSRLLLEAAAGDVKISAGHVVFTVGTAVYRVAI